MTSADIYFTDIFENTSDLIQYVNFQGNIEMVNPAWLNTLGYSLEEVKDKSIYEFLNKDEKQLYKIYRDLV